MTRRIHFARAHDADARALQSALCGWQAVELTERVADTTCRVCRRRIDELGLVDPSPAEPATYGTRELTDVASEALERAHRGERPEARGWPSVHAAVRFYVSSRDEGASLRSTSDPDRAHRVQRSLSSSIGGREHDAIERGRTVAVALDRAEYALALGPLADMCPSLTARQARHVYLLRVCGRLIVKRTGLSRAPRKGIFGDRLGMRVIDVVHHLADVHGIAVTERQVSRITRHFDDALEVELVRTGEMRKHHARERAPRADDLEQSAPRRVTKWDPVGRIRRADHA